MLALYRNDFGYLLNSKKICVLWRRVSDMDDDIRSYWRSLLDQSEREKAHAFRFSEDRDSYLAAHSLLRQSLSTLTGIDPRSLFFSKGPLGKPELLDQSLSQSLRINLSHTRGMVAVAISPGFNVGVDVEPLSQVVESGFGSYVLASEEVSELSKVPAQRYSQELISLWTIKEALIKASGQGMSAGLRDIVCGINSLQLLDPGPLPGAAHEWRIWQHSQNNGFALSVAAHVAESDELGCCFLEADPYGPFGLPKDKFQ